MLVSPDHSRGYMWGVRKLQPLNGMKEYWDFTYEMGQYEGAKEMLNRIQFGSLCFMTLITATVAKTWVRA